MVTNEDVVAGRTDVEGGRRENVEVGRTAVEKTLMCENEIIERNNKMRCM